MDIDFDKELYVSAFICTRSADEIERLTAENERLRAALRTGCGAAINDLPPGQREWSPDSGIGVMLKALGCEAVVYGDDVYNAVRPVQQSESIK